MLIGRTIIVEVINISIVWVSIQNNMNLSATFSKCSDIEIKCIRVDIHLENLWVLSRYSIAKVQYSFYTAPDFIH